MTLPISFAQRREKIEFRSDCKDLQHVTKTRPAGIRSVELQIPGANIDTFPVTPFFFPSSIFSAFFLLLYLDEEVLLDGWKLDEEKILPRFQLFLDSYIDDCVHLIVLSSTVFQLALILSPSVYLLHVTKFYRSSMTPILFLRPSRLPVQNNCPAVNNWLNHRLRLAFLMFTSVRFLFQLFPVLHRHVDIMYTSITDTDTPTIHGNS